VLVPLCSESDCRTNIQAKIDAVSTGCTGADASIFVDSTFAANLRKGSNMINTLCTKDGDTYCFVTLKNSQASSPSTHAFASAPCRA
jgi:hypothetical protein